jgi:ferritin-like metal-binding protein YciE
MPTNSIQALFTSELKDIYDAEKRLTRALPKMAKAASSDELRSALEEHLAITKEQVARLEEVFQLLELKPQAKTCEAMKGLIAEGEEVMEERMDENLMDLSLVGAGRRVEHYEMAAYKTLIGLAPNLESGDQIEKLLQQTLEEEDEADRKLAEVAESLIGEAESDSEASDEEEQESEVSSGSRRR